MNRREAEDLVTLMRIEQPEVWKTAVDAEICARIDDWLTAERKLGITDEVGNAVICTIRQRRMGVIT